MFKHLSKTQNSHVKNRVNARTTITGQTMFLCKNETKMIGMPCLHSKITVACYNNRFFGVFRLAEFFRRLLG